MENGRLDHAGCLYSKQSGHHFDYFLVIIMRVYAGQISASLLYYSLFKDFLTWATSDWDEHKMQQLRLDWIIFQWLQIWVKWYITFSHTVSCLQMLLWEFGCAEIGGCILEDSQTPPAAWFPLNMLLTYGHWWLNLFGQLQLYPAVRMQLLNGAAGLLHNRLSA